MNQDPNNVIDILALALSEFNLNFLTSSVRI